jgi:uncharacterized protein (TIGR02265 family)
MPKELLVFAPTIEGLFVKSLGPLMTPAFKSLLKGHGIDLAKIQPSYSFAVWQTCVLLAAKEYFPHDPAPAALQKLGERAVHGFNETLIGKFALAALKLVGPKQALIRAGANFRSSNNFTETTLVEKGPGDYELSINQVAQLAYFNAGVILAALKFAGANDLKVDLLSQKGDGATFRVRWKT